MKIKNQSLEQRIPLGRTMAVMIMCILLSLASACEEPQPFDPSADVRNLPDDWAIYRVTEEFSAIIVDQSGAIWGGGFDGLFKKEAGADDFSPVLHSDRSYPIVRALYEDAKGAIWIGHTDGISVHSNRHTQHIESFNGESVGFVRSIIQSPDGTMLFGTPAGLWVVPADTAIALASDAKTAQTDTIKRLTVRDGLHHNMVNTMMYDSNGALWLGAYIAQGGGVTVLHHNRRQTFDTNDGLVQNYINAFCEAADGLIWVATGVFHRGGANAFAYENGEYRIVRRIVVDDGLAGDKVRHLHRDAHDNLWFCSEFDGISVFSKDLIPFHLFTVENGLSDNEIKDIAEDSFGNMWLATAFGITFIPIEWLIEHLWSQH